MTERAKAAFNKKKKKKKILFISIWDLNLRKTLVRCYIWSTALYGTETRKFQTEGQKCLKSYKILSWRKMQKITWADHVRNEKVSQRVKEERNILHRIKSRNIN
jgi:hypothetical protein